MNVLAGISSLAGFLLLFVLTVKLFIHLPIQDMLWKERSINWNDFATDCKRGSCCYRVQTNEKVINPKTQEEVSVTRNAWVVDKEIPIFTQDREFIERLL